MSCKKVDAFLLFIIFSNKFPVGIGPEYTLFRSFWLSASLQLVNLRIADAPTRPEISGDVKWAAWPQLAARYA